MSPETPAEAPHAPVQPSQRLTTVDTLRGFALAGILLSNLKMFASPMFADTAGGIPVHGAADELATGFLHLFVEGRFYPLFSLLFGLGLFLQMGRAEERGARFVPLYLRRLAVLLCIGLVHALLIWSGDILVTYAVLGLPLILFRKVPRGWLLVFIGLFLALPLLLHAARFARSRNTPQAAQLRSPEMMARMKEVATRGFSAYRGSYPEAVAQRSREVPLAYQATVLSDPIIFAMFLLGLWMGRKGLLHQPEAHLPLLRRIFFASLALGLAAGLPELWLRHQASGGRPTAGMLFLVLVSHLGGQGLSLTYLSGLTLLLRREAWRRRLAPLAAAGRMSLSNYLLQSIVCTMLFYGYGFGLFGKVGHAGQVGVALILYPLQLALSSWWVERFRFGPTEWLWRSLTYGRPQPMRREDAAPALG